MRVYTYKEARQHLAEVLNVARSETVLIKRKNGDAFVARLQEKTGSPFDVPGIDTNVTGQDIVDAVRDSRARG